MNKPDRVIIDHMVQTIAIFAEYAKANRSLFTEEDRESFKALAERLQQKTEEDN